MFDFHHHLESTSGAFAPVAWVEEADASVELATGAAARPLEPDPGLSRLTDFLRQRRIIGPSTSGVGGEVRVSGERVMLASSGSSEVLFSRHEPIARPPWFELGEAGGGLEARSSRSLRSLGDAWSSSSSGMAPWLAELVLARRPELAGSPLRRAPLESGWGRRPAPKTSRVAGLAEHLPHQADAARRLVEAAALDLFARFGEGTQLRVERVFFHDGGGPEVGQIYLVIGTKLDAARAHEAFEAFLEQHWLDRAEGVDDAPALTIEFI